MRALDQDEIAWALECAAAGDSYAEIAETAGCSVADVANALGRREMTPRERDVAGLYAAGSSIRDIDAELGFNTSRPGSAAAARLCELRRKGWPIAHRVTAQRVAQSCANGHLTAERRYGHANG